MNNIPVMIFDEADAARDVNSAGPSRTQRTGKYRNPSMPDEPERGAGSDRAQLDIDDRTRAAAQLWEPGVTRRRWFTEVVGLPCRYLHDVSGVADHSLTRRALGSRHYSRPRGTFCRQLRILCGFVQYWGLSWMHLP